VEVAAFIAICLFLMETDLCSELRTRMTLLSAYEDFVVRTLASVRGLLARLVYLGSLRNDDGDYCHWGMSKTFGQSRASEALAQAHTEAWLEVLRTPIPALFAETQDSTLETDLGLGNETWRGQLEKLTPPDVSGGTKRHFNSILLTLSLLSQAAKEPNQRAA
jgi:hypothetical protein